MLKSEAIVRVLEEALRTCPNIVQVVLCRWGDLPIQIGRSGLPADEPRAVTRTADSASLLEAEQMFGNATNVFSGEDVSLAIRTANCTGIIVHALAPGATLVAQLDYFPSLGVASGVLRRAGQKIVGDLQ